jgi:hypothetical protein
MDQESKKRIQERINQLYKNTEILKKRTRHLAENKNNTITDARIHYRKNVSKLIKPIIELTQLAVKNQVDIEKIYKQAAQEYIDNFIYDPEQIPVKNIFENTLKNQKELAKQLHNLAFMIRDFGKMCCIPNDQEKIFGQWYTRMSYSHFHEKGQEAILEIINQISADMPTSIEDVETKVESVVKKLIANTYEEYNHEDIKLYRALINEISKDYAYLKANIEKISSQISDNETMKQLKYLKEVYALTHNSSKKLDVDCEGKFWGYELEMHNKKYKEPDQFRKKLSEIDHDMQKVYIKTDKKNQTVLSPKSQANFYREY